MSGIRCLCVYCGSSPGAAPAYRTTAAELGTALAHAGIELVFGGGRVGLMGVVADAVLAGAGRVTGIIPDRLRARELAHLGLSELIVFDTMHERKRQMAERADAFAVLPGGIGTLDEFFEIVSWRQLGLHDKPIFVVDVSGYWRGLAVLLDHIVAEGFARAEARRLVRILPDIPSLMAELSATPLPRSETESDLI